MKVTIDTDAKTIHIDSNIKAGDFVRELKSLLGDKWKEYEIIENVTYYPLTPYYPITYTDNNLYFKQHDYEPPYGITYYGGLVENN